MEAISWFKKVLDPSFLSNDIRDATHIKIFKFLLILTDMASSKASISKWSGT